MDEQTQVTISIDGRKSIVETADLRAQLQQAQDVEFAEVWLERGPEMLSLLTNSAQQRAFLMFLTEENQAGFHALDNSSVEQDAEIDFFLNNGQQDQYEFSDTIALSEGIRAVEFFFAHGGRAPFILWQDDSV